MVLLSMVDITERNRAVEALQHSVQEKETLLREVHHRVKNNLAAIISLLELQQDQHREPQNRSLLAEMAGRIQSMALIHEMLYRSTNLSEIDLHTYLQTLMGYLHGAFNPDRAIQIQVAAHGVRMNLDTAIPCGLIVNELVINAFKHAFPAARLGLDPATITISATWDRLTYTLIVADNGVGLPADLDWTTTRSLGLRLVRMLGQHQLQGTIELDRIGGTRVTLRFGAA
jgi:two-component sensor histidine kinase